MTATPAGMGREQIAEPLEAMIGGMSALSPAELIAAAGLWLSAEEVGGFSSGTCLVDDADGWDGRKRDRPGVIIASEAAFLLEGAALQWHLEDDGEGVTELCDKLRRALVGRLWTRPALGSFCSGIYAKSGAACRASVAADGFTSVCGRHKAQDLITTLSRVTRAYPRFDSSVVIFGGAREPPGPFVALVVCSICARGRPMEECVTECAALGRADPGGADTSVFSHYPDWVADAGPGRFDRPGFQFCLACAAEFPVSCQLIGFRAASEDACTDGVLLADEATLGPRSLWVFCPPIELVSPTRVSLLSLFAQQEGIAVSSAFSVAGAPDTPGMAATVAIRSALAKQKAGTNTANRSRLGGEVELGRQLGGTFDAQQVGGGGGSMAGAAQPPVYKFGPPAVAEVPVREDVSSEARLFAALGLGGTREDILPLLETYALDLAARRGMQVPVMVAGLSSQAVRVPAGGVTQADMEDMRSQLTGQIDALKLHLSSGRGGRTPVPPLTLVYPMEVDEDGFGVTDPAHTQSLRRSGGEDYLGAILDPAAHGNRRKRHCHMRRIDIPDDPEGVPGSDYGAGHEDFMMFGDIRVSGKLKKNGLPTRGDSGRFAQSRMTDLNEQLRRGEGIFSKASAYRDWAVYETKIMLVRYQFMAAVEHYLTDVRKPATPWGVIYRYQCILVKALWRHKAVAHIGMDRDLGELALTLDLDQLRVRQGSPVLLTVASQFINLDWLEEAEREAGAVASKSAAKPTDDKPTPRKCLVCGKSTCGLYVEPGWACTSEIVVPCFKCKKRHVLGGPRAWRCASAKAAIEILSAADWRVASRVSYSKFIAGETAVAAGQVAAVKAAC